MSRHNRERRALRMVETPKPGKGLTVPEAISGYVTQTQKQRSCNGCTACCSTTGVAALGKPPQCACVHETPTGCGIYGRHPYECKEYSCLWRMGWGGEEDRPDRLGLLLHMDRDPWHPDDLLYSSIELLELKPGAIVKRFPKGFEDYKRLRCGDKTLTITLHFYGTPRARPPWILPPYTSDHLPEGKEDFIGNEVVLVQLGVIDRDGMLHTGTTIATPEQRMKLVEKVIGR